MEENSVEKRLPTFESKPYSELKTGKARKTLSICLAFIGRTFYRWIPQYRAGGFEALKKKSATGKKPKLNGKQMQKLYQIITSKNPLQLDFEFALWTRAMVRELIRERFEVRLSDVSVGRLLRKLGLSPQKPLYRAYQRGEEKIKVWEEKAYPEIKKMAKKEKATIYFGDEASIRSDHHYGTTWSAVGQTPVIETTGARFSIQMVLTVSAKGSFRFMTFAGRMNGKRFIGLSSLVKTMHFSARL